MVVIELKPPYAQKSRNGDPNPSTSHDDLLLPTNAPLLLQLGTSSLQSNPKKENIKQQQNLWQYLPIDDLC